MNVKKRKLMKDDLRIALELIDRYEDYFIMQDFRDIKKFFEQAEENAKNEN